MTTRPRLTLERTFDAPIDDVWELLTTRDGMESWMGPDGFTVAVQEVDLRPGGRLVYAMTAIGPDQVEYMTKAGMPLINTQRVTFDVVEPPRRLAYHDLADFIPGVAPYNVATDITLEGLDARTRMVLTFDAMHDENWTEMAKLGHEGELRKFEAALAARQ